jgi:hypothetical protein
MKKRTPKLRLHRETLHRLEPARLRAAAGGFPTLDIGCLASQQATFCGEVTCGPCAYTVDACLTELCG